MRFFLARKTLRIKNPCGGDRRETSYTRILKIKNGSLFDHHVTNKEPFASSKNFSSLGKN
ncbi:MAG: hypothetical protein UY42_C0001G0039 [Parcubacteria group bacterium GW2011_GWA2_49_16]|nr:MAG: hypothetical protein UY42_C0001G0039 [Parcubacteria group bacterium GW2011_GWA2_49_16]